MADILPVGPSPWSCLSHTGFWLTPPCFLTRSRPLASQTIIHAGTQTPEQTVASEETMIHISWLRCDLSWWDQWGWASSCSHWDSSTPVHTHTDVHVFSVCIVRFCWTADTLNVKMKTSLFKVIRYDDECWERWTSHRSNRPGGSPTEVRAKPTNKLYNPTKYIPMYAESSFLLWPKLGWFRVS